MKCAYCNRNLKYIRSCVNTPNGYFCDYECVANFKLETEKKDSINPSHNAIGPNSSAAEILEAGAIHMKDRAATYDTPSGERSISKTVSAFNSITGHNITPEQGWLFMTLLKIVRSQQGDFKMDNYEDGAAYFALMGEQASEDR